MGQGVSIQRTQETTGMRLRRFLGGAIELEPSLGRVVADLSAWAALVAREGADSLQTGQSDTGGTVPTYIGAIAGQLTKSVPETGRDLVSKSLQEALFYSIGADSSLSRTLFAKTLAKSLRQENADALVRGFLSLHVFNAAWLLSGESFRAQAPSHDAFLEDMETVESICYRVVDSAWESLDIRCPLSVSAADQLINQIGALFYA